MGVEVKGWQELGGCFSHTLGLHDLALEWFVCENETYTRQRFSTDAIPRYGTPVLPRILLYVNFFRLTIRVYNAYGMLSTTTESF